MNRLSDVRSALAANTTLANLKTLLFLYFLLTNFVKAQRHVRARGLAQTLSDLVRYVVQRAILVALKFPAARKKVEAEMGQAKLDIEAKLVPHGEGVTRHLSLPDEGKGKDWIEAEMAKMDTEMGHGTDWRHGKLSGAVYHGGEDMQEIIVAAFNRYCVSNPLHPDVFPAIRKMEAEIVSMCLRMYNNPTGAGTTTSGGTESILMSVKTHRDWARATKGITEPEMIIPETAHAAFNKGAAYFKIKLHVIPVDPLTRQVNLKRVRRAINGNTIMLVGSAINFPDGCQDPITELGRLAVRHKIGLHVDCCLGSFIMPFLAEAGFPVEPFDFRVPGVSAISCDTHKYGFAPKGSSVVMYRDSELRRHQFYVQPDWVGGVYASPAMSGSRPGALIAGTWAAMQYMGRAGYVESCRAIVACAKKIEAAIGSGEFPELYVLGKPPASVVAFGSRVPGLSVLEVGDAMGRRGWHLNGISNPPAVHIACTRLTVGNVDTFIGDLRDSVQEAKLKPTGKGNMVAVYGLGNSSPVGPSMVGELAAAFLEAMYKA